MDPDYKATYLNILQYDKAAHRQCSCPYRRLEEADLPHTPGKKPPWLHCPTAIINASTGGKELLVGNQPAL